MKCFTANRNRVSPRPGIIFFFFLTFTKARRVMFSFPRLSAKPWILEKLCTQLQIIFTYSSSSFAVMANGSFADLAARLYNYKSNDKKHSSALWGPKNNWEIDSYDSTTYTFSWLMTSKEIRSTLHSVTAGKGMEWISVSTGRNAKITGLS